MKLQWNSPELHSAGIVDSVQLQRALVPVAANNEHLARYLNLISYIEYIGTRALVMSFQPAEVDFLSLGHVLEEARHAFFFRRLAAKLTARNLTYSAQDTASGESARRYVNRTAAGFNRIISGRKISEQRRISLTVLYTSAVLEVRAVWWYRNLQQVLLQQGSSISLQPILVDEANHLNRLEVELTQHDPEWASVMEQMFLLDRRNFSRFNAAALRALGINNKSNTVVNDRPLSANIVSSEINAQH